MTEIQEQINIRQLRAGSTEAFEELLTEYEKRIYALSFRMLGSKEDAEDATQETFLRLWNSIASYQSKAKFSTWLFTLCSNVCIDMLRKRKDTASLDEENEDGNRIIDPPSNEPSPEEEAQRNETVSEVQRAINELPETFRTPLVMREMSGLSYAEISAATDVPEATVKTRIFRARTMLKEKLLESGNFSLSSSSKLNEKKSKKGGADI